MKVSKELEIKEDTHSHHRHQSLVLKLLHNYEVNDVQNCHGDDHKRTLDLFHLNHFQLSLRLKYWKWDFYTFSVFLNQIFIMN